MEASGAALGRDGAALPNISHTQCGVTQAPQQRAAEAEQEAEQSPRPDGHCLVPPDIFVVPLM